ncbi:N-acetyl-gamma-glutamyl-phosphate reductase [Methylophaga thiooxydans]|uniref:N-acetyl-gamma-glutamyl-phosphate reductase n=1 Tax=Methylophaga thiooxydans TaxID=392484 RepID=A0A0A0BGY4_9GAMM|nr:N-acetyl-gamma-glutamyl-phosphate reductase [Methylophaga thiooxydans]KGM07748.1 N-acetyl-gamma-glutamyl-phosphate reductase [Methylophaga thiooxydans]
MIKVGIVGGTGYTGVELLRLLANHPEVSLDVITSRSEAGMAVSELFPNLRGHVDLKFSEPDPEVLARCDVVFFATPHTVAMALVPELIKRDTRVIDLSADFRLKDVKVWEQWYNTEHTCPELFEQAVYGLPEINREQIKPAQLVAVPGCYPTATELGFLPLLEAGLIDPKHLIADAKTGVSGAGRKAAIPMLMAETSGSFKAYGVSGHRHLPEIREILSAHCGEDVDLTFIPHLAPMVRGIHATLYGRLNKQADLQALFESRYQHEPFVDVMPAGSMPETRSVQGANVCRIAVHQPQGSDTVVVLSVIDNLVKGASGQAIQNMNIMFGFEETLGIDVIATMP